MSAQAFTIGGNKNRIAYSEHHSDNVGGMTDYYFLMGGGGTGKAQDNIIEHCKAFRHHNGGHKGHGFDIKGGSNNIIRNCSTFRTQVESMFKTTHHNLYENITLEGDGAGLYLFNGAHDNTYRNIHIKGGVYQAIALNVQDDGASNDPEVDAHIGPYNNDFINVVVEKSQKLISIGESSLSVNVNAKCENNRFYNCVWSGNTQGIAAYIDAKGFEFVNCSFNDNSSKSFVSLASAPSYPDANFEAKFENCNFHGNGFSAPSGAGATNLTQHDPKFVNASAGDYRLQSDSALIDLGKATPHTTAFDGTKRPLGSGFDIGAFER